MLAPLQSKKPKSTNKKICDNEDYNVVRRERTLEVVQIPTSSDETLAPPTTMANVINAPKNPITKTKMKNVSTVNCMRHNKGEEAVNVSHHPLSRLTSPEIQRTKPKVDMQRIMSTRHNNGEHKTNERTRRK